MPVAYARLASQVPTPIAVASPSLGQPSTPFATGSTYSPPAGTSLRFNQVAAAVKLLCEYGGGGYGILSGCDLSDGGGLNVAVSAGILVGDGILELTGGTPAGAAPVTQVATPGVYTLADGATNYVWLTSSGALVSSTSLAYPTGAKWFLGTVTTVAGAITTIDYSGRISLSGGRFTRQTANIGAPDDSPDASLSLVTQTTTGRYRWSGSLHEFMAPPPNKQTLSADLTLTALSALNHFLVASGANRTVLLPALSALPHGRTYWIMNYGATNNILVKDATGATTYCTLTPGQAIGIPTLLDSSGNTAFPATYTPGVPTAGSTGLGGAA